MLDRDKKLDRQIIIYANEGMLSSATATHAVGGKGRPQHKMEPMCEWLEYRNSVSDMALVKERLGVDVVLQDPKELSGKARGVPEQRVRALVADWTAGAREIEGDPQEILTESARWHIALKQDLEEKEAAGFTTICSQIEHRYGCNPCFAFMMLADEGYCFSCGIDINGLLTELMLNAIEPGAMFQGNLMVQNLERGRVSVHHCMAPYTMDSEREYDVRYAHSDRKRKGLVSAIRFKKGTVTLARLDASLELIHISRGTLVDYVNHRDRCINEAIIEVPYSEDFDRQRIKPRLPSKIVHYVMRQGDYVDSLCKLAQALGIECLKD